MSAFSLKILALVTMVIDHIGAVFFPQYTFIRVIGRLSFPIYAFLIAEGFRHTRSRTKYFLRLFVFGILSELPYDLLFYGELFHPESQNIMFELALGVPLLCCVEKIRQSKKHLFVLPAAALVLLSEVLGLSYGIYGIFLMLTAYISENKGRKIQALYSAGTTIIFNSLARVYIPFMGDTLRILSLNSTQSLAVFAALPIMFYNGEKGRSGLKWFFYCIYPAHLTLLILVKCIIKI